MSACVALHDASGTQTGQRTLQEPAGGCRALLEAVVLAVTIAIDPLALTRPEPAPQPAPRPRPEEQPPMERRPDSASPAPLASPRPRQS